ncbi:MAG: type II secretion system F family protein, partial [Fimbriimonas ginsengisoli]|nr:type II secretion system F family protein [Fimbriimonas ginsengisoli]
MPRYEYTARDKAGNITTGMIFAETDSELRDTLRVNDLFLTKYERRAETAATQPGLFRSRKVKLQDMVVMSRQFATLVRAGIPIVESISTVAMQSEHPVLAEALRDVRLRVIGGTNLAEAMREHPKVFSELYCSLIEAGQVGGVLEQTLDIAAHQFDREAVLRQQVKAALAYPILVVTFACLVVAGMILGIVPVFKKVYTQFHADLPAITQLLVSISDVATHWWWLFVLVVVGTVLAWRAYRASPRGRLATDRLFLHLPVVGKVVRKVAISRFTQTFGSATTGGIPILRALAVSAKTAGNY